MSETPTPPRRRWFRFSLRTMFVLVTVFAVFVGWLAREWRIVREREEWIRYNYDGDHPHWLAQGDDLGVSLPIWRTWLGDHPVRSIYPYDAWTAEERSKAERLFPEAEFPTGRINSSMRHYLYP